MNKLSPFAVLHLCVSRETFLLVMLALIAGSIFAQDKVLIRDKRLNEISGIAASRINSGLYYVHNDSGGDNEVYVINAKGKTISSITISGVVNRDWEDIAVGPGPDKNRSYIYVGEIGDNKAQYANLFLYRISEPKFKPNKERKQKTIIVPAAEVEIFAFTFEDGAKDCETLFIDPDNGDVYLVSKREEKVGLYLIKAPLSSSETNIARRISSFSFPLAVAGDISSQRDKILIKTYSDIYAWDVATGQSISDALSTVPYKLFYEIEPQGESACWSLDGKHYITLSEKSDESKLYLYIYP